MLSSVLKSKRAVHVNIEIMRTFVRLRELLAIPKPLLARSRPWSTSTTDSSRCIRCSACLDGTVKAPQETDWFPHGTGQMSHLPDKDRFNPGKASTAPATCVVDTGVLTDRVRCAMNAAIAANTKEDRMAHDVGDILKAMWDTHASIISVYVAAERVEKETDRYTGRWMDTLLLARPPYEALFIALLLAHDYQKWNLAYHRAGWAAEARQSFHTYRRYGRTQPMRELHVRNIKKLKTWARGVGSAAESGSPHSPKFEADQCDAEQRRMIESTNFRRQER